MTKKNLQKILTGGTLEAKDLTPEEKKHIYSILGSYGMSQSTAYLRMFDKGFDRWEIMGVNHIRNEFLLTVPCSDGSGDEEGSRGYGYIQTLSPDYDDSQFYDLVTSMQVGVKLCDFMAERGMASQTTVRNRFKANDWKPWELVGIHHILNNL